MAWINPEKVGRNIYNRDGVRIGSVSKGGTLNVHISLSEDDQEDLIDQGFYEESPVVGIIPTEEDDSDPDPQT